MGFLTIRLAHDNMNKLFYNKLFVLFSILMFKKIFLLFLSNNDIILKKLLKVR